MPKQATEERATAICHKRHGWLTAPDGYYFRVSASGKSYELVGGPAQESTLAHFPFGTRWLASSIIAVGD